MCIFLYDVSSGPFRSNQQAASTSCNQAACADCNTIWSPTPELIREKGLLNEVTSVMCSIKIFSDQECSARSWDLTCLDPRRCKTSSVGQSVGLSIPRSSVRFQQTIEKKLRTQTYMDLSHIDPQTRYKITLLMMIAFSTFVCLFVRIKSKNQYSASCWEGSKLCGSDHTRAESHNTCIPKTAVQTTYVSI